MVYGVLQLINFAHGDIFMLGAMMGWYASSRWTQEAAHPTWFGAIAVTLVCMAICGTTGFLIERFGYRPLRGSPKLNSLITPIGFSFLLEYARQLVFGPNPPPFRPLPVSPTHHVRPLRLSLSYLPLIRRARLGG